MNKIVFKRPSHLKHQGLIYCIAVFVYNIFMDVTNIEIIDENTAILTYNEENSPEWMKR